MKLQSSLLVYGDHIDTDVIIPARYLAASTESELAKHCMEDIDPLFPTKARTSHIIVAGENFGCGSSREHAPIALKASGIQLIVAKSFARIFFRNAINIGLAILECPPLCETAQEGDRVSVDLDTGMIHNLSQNTSFTVPPFPTFIQAVIEAGGLLEKLKEN